MTLPVYHEDQAFGDGANLVFDYNFKIFDATNLTVWKEDTLTGLVTQYSQSEFVVTGAGDDDGGTITLLGSPPLSTDRITVASAFLYAQQTTISPEGGFSPTLFERALDQIERTVQQVATEVGRSIRGVPGDVWNMLDGATRRANKYVAFDGDGKLALTEVVDPVAISTAIATYAEAQALTVDDKLITPLKAAYSMIAGSILMYDTLALATAAMVPTAAVANVGMVGTRGYSAVGDGGGSVYSRVASMPLHQARFQSADGQWWVAVPSVHGFDTRAVGVKFDGNPSGSVGTDNAAALNAAFGTPFPILLANGYACFDSKLTITSRQPISGIAPADDSLSGLSGSGLVYRGAGARSGGSSDANEVAIEGTGPFVGETLWQRFTISSQSTNTATWLVRLHSPRNTNFYKVYFTHKNPSMLSGSPVTITGITLANPCVVSYSGAAPTNGDRIRITGVGGMTQLNNMEFFVSAVGTDGPNNFRIGIDTSNSDPTNSTYTPYTSGGQFQKCALFWDTQGGDQGTGGLIGGSCIQVVKDSPGDITWQYRFTECRFVTSVDRMLANANQDQYLGYGFAVDIAGTDIYLMNCHANNAAYYGRQGGAIIAVGGNCENMSAGGDTGWYHDRGSHRGQFIFSNFLLPTMAGCVTGLNINNSGWIVICDSHYSTGWCDNRILVANNTINRTSDGAAMLIGNSSFKATGFVWGKQSFLNTFTGDNEDPIVYIPQTWRGSAVDWRGHTVIGTVLPNEWVVGMAPIAWTPGFGIAPDVRGLKKIDLGVRTDPGLVATDVMTGYGGPRSLYTSAGDGVSQAGTYSDQLAFWRGDAWGKGGFYWKTRFGMRTFGATNRLFVGLSATTAVLSGDPTTFRNCVGVCWKPGIGSNNLFAVRGRAAVTDIEDLGALFPANSNTTIFVLEIWAAPFGNAYFLRIRNLFTKRVIPVKRYAADIPDPTVLLTCHHWFDENGTNTPLGFMFYGMEGRPSDDLIGGAI